MSRKHFLWGKVEAIGGRKATEHKTKGWSNKLSSM